MHGWFVHVAACDWPRLKWDFRDRDDRGWKIKDPILLSIGFGDWPSLLYTLEDTSAAWPGSVSGPNQTVARPIVPRHHLFPQANLAVTCHPLLPNFMKPRNAHRSSETGPPRSYTSAIRVWTMTWLPSWLPCGASKKIGLLLTLLILKHWKGLLTYPYTWPL